MAAQVLPNPLSTTAWTKALFASRLQLPLTSSAALVPLSEPAVSYATKSTAYIVSHNGEPFPSWVRPTIAAFNEIGSLPDNWDTYGGRAVKVERIEESFSLLRLVMQPNSPAPSVVPLSDGGVQVEWHRKQQDLEIVFPGIEDGLYLYSNRATGDEFEGSVREIEKLASLIGQLA